MYRRILWIGKGTAFALKQTGLAGALEKGDIYETAVSILYTSKGTRGWYKVLINVGSALSLQISAEIYINYTSFGKSNHLLWNCRVINE
jgi:hypothetical protein